MARRNEKPADQATGSGNAQSVKANAHHIDIGDTRLFVEERGAGYPLLVLHGGPGAIDHRFFGNYLNPLCDHYRLILVDERSHGRSEPAPENTCSFEQLVKDVSALAHAMKLGRYAVLGHSYGAFVALQHAVSFPGDAARRSSRTAFRRRGFYGSTWS